VLTSAPRQRPGADLPPWKGDSADLQLLENENQIVPNASFPAHLPIESAPQPACPACDVPPEPAIVGSLLVKPNRGTVCPRFLKNSPPQLRRGGALSDGVVVTVGFHPCRTTLPSLTSHRKYSPPQLRRGGALSDGVVVTVVFHPCRTTTHSLTSHRKYRRPQRRRSAMQYCNFLFF